ncbi:MAG: hypothetical protein HKO92_09405 [Flavobacteriaceae bacterium]|nr:hypothetical protein [Flavobacteriaceae bacterium]
MKKLLTSLIIAALGFSIQCLHAQSSFATIIKNVNVRAQGVKHTLNSSRDTLLLKSDRKINYVYAINRSYKKELYDFIDDKSYKIPLTNFSAGKYTFVVGQSPLKIVFAIYIHKPNEEEVYILSNSSTYSTLD